MDALKSLPLLSVAKKDPEQALGPLADYLRDGSLALVLGTGVSMPLGLPRWWELVAKCVQANSSAHTVTVSTPVSQLSTIMEEVEAQYPPDGKEFRELVRKCLYDGVNYSLSSIQQPLLIALGALLMGSKRGSVSTVLTLNFDDVLEWYLSVHGFTVQIITKLPQLKKDADVTVYHLHGFLPLELHKHSARMSDFLILSEFSFDQRMGDRLNLYTQVFRDLLLSKLVLFVGLSGDDPTVKKLLVDEKSRIENSRYTGVWFFRRKLADSEIEAWNRRNILPLCFDDANEIPPFILKICELAAG
jgi:hypothetical protein